MTEYISDPLGHSAELEVKDGKIVLTRSYGGNRNPDRKVEGLFGKKKVKENPIKDAEKRLADAEEKELLQQVRLTKRLTDWREQY
jgi:hypothetical protein